MSGQMIWFKPSRTPLLPRAHTFLISVAMRFSSEGAADTCSLKKEESDWSFSRPMAAVTIHVRFA
jgi:hypothetical protein